MRNFLRGGQFLSYLERIIFSEGNLLLDFSCRGYVFQQIIFSEGNFNNGAIFRGRLIF